MRKYGLIGYPLGHSFSKGYFTEKFKRENLTDCEYENYPISQIDHLRMLIEKDPEINGLNVTIPYKEQVIPMLSELDDIALQIGAVNTIKIVRNSGHIHLKGFNTDYYGFEETIKPLIKGNHQKALILGTGGASKSVAFVFDRLNISYKYVSRKPADNQIFSYNDITNEILKEYEIIVNTSPVGMFPDIEGYPELPYSSLTKNHILYDLIYNPEKTKFLQKGELKDAKILNGLPMLLMQAEKAWEFWNS